MSFKYILTFLLILSYISPANNRQAFCVIQIINKKNRLVKLIAEIADTAKKRRIGLMYRKHMGRNRGMLFKFSSESRLNFWMKNTYIPLSIAYISKDCIIKDIQNMKPLDTSKTYPSRYPAKFALEVNKGWFKKNNITRGCRIKFNGCFSK